MRKWVADGLNRRYRYLREIEFGGEVIVKGMDVSTLNVDGQIEGIDGFFAHAPPPLEKASIESSVR